MNDMPFQATAYNEKGKSITVTVIARFPLLSLGGEDADEYGYVVDTDFGSRHIMVEQRLVPKSDYKYMIGVIEDGLEQMKAAIAMVEGRDNESVGADRAATKAEG